MLRKSTWEPRINTGTGRLHERLAEAFADDIIEQVIGAGARLPPHRELAYQLKISVGTVTKAYALLERQGLVRVERGSATFAIGLSPSSSTITDLSVNVPPRVVSDRLLSNTLFEVAKRIDVNTFASHAPVSGALSHRSTLAKWIARGGARIDPDNLILCNGAQHALAVAVGALCKSGSTIITEQLPFSGIASLAHAMGISLVGLEMDAEGLTASALEAWLSENRVHHRDIVLYCTPTAQNPGGGSMSHQRRSDVSSICRRFDVTIIEDDVYALLRSPDIPMLSELAPERTIYISGLSKALTPGLRIGILVCPPTIKDKAIAVMTSIGAPAAPLACLIMERWILDGTADHISNRIKLEASRRASFVSSALNIRIPSMSTFHIFVPTSLADASLIVDRAYQEGVRVTPPSIALDFEKSGLAGVRLCLGSPSFEELKSAIEAIGAIISDNASIQRSLNHINLSSRTGFRS